MLPPPLGLLLVACLWPEVEDAQLQELKSLFGGMMWSPKRCALLVFVVFGVAFILGVVLAPGVAFHGVLLRLGPRFFLVFSGGGGGGGSSPAPLFIAIRRAFVQGGP